MENTSRRHCLLDWIKVRYQDVTIPVSGGPYLEHVETVATLAGRYSDLGYEIGLSHDLLEDRICTADVLEAALMACGYHPDETAVIISATRELSDVYTKQAYPILSKKQRHRKEDERLTTLSAAAQTVKYADLVYNIAWTLRYQQKGVRSYLRRKYRLLKKMDQGDPALRKLARNAAKQALAGFEKDK